MGAKDILRKYGRQDNSKEDTEGELDKHGNGGI